MHGQPNPNSPLHFRKAQPALTKMKIVQCLNTFKAVNLKMRSLLFWDFRQRRLVVSYGRFGTTYRSHLQR
jgi:hypothetical protein